MWCQVFRNKQKIVIDIILKKCSVKNSRGVRCDNEFILESLGVSAKENNNCPIPILSPVFAYRLLYIIFGLNLATLVLYYT